MTRYTNTDAIPVKEAPQPVTRTRYTVYDNTTDFPVIVCGTSRECCHVMGISISMFYNLLWKQRNNIHQSPRWHIVVETGCDW